MKHYGPVLTTTNETRRAVRIAAAAPVIAAIAITFAACSDNDSDETSASAEPSATAAVSTATSSAVSAQPSQTTTGLEVIRTAESATGGKVFDVESDSKGASGTEWDVKVAGNDGTQDNLTVSGDGRTVTSRTRAAKPDDDVAKLKQATIALQQAISEADPRAQGKGAFSSAEIDTSNGTVVWQVSFGGDSGTTVLVDARNGSVLKVGRDAG